MFPSWLTSSTSKESAIKPIEQQHAVLGTPLQNQLTKEEEEIFFACGCFWGAEKGFWKLPGVVTTAVGYAGGHTEKPTYNQVCSGRTGHTEVVRVVWNKSIIDLSDLLKLFWECHDPTQGDRQGNDHGSQYRSAIYTTEEAQYNIVVGSRDSYQKALNTKGFGTITTEIKTNQVFYYAENYHQQYLTKPGNRPYCSAIPTNVLLGNFSGANYEVKKEVWAHFDWTTSHCVLRSNNHPITNQK